MKKLIFVCFINYIVLIYSRLQKDEDNNEPTIEATIVGINTKTIMQDGVKRNFIFYNFRKRRSSI